MKRLIALALAMILCASFMVSCSDKTGTTKDTTKEEATTVPETTPELSKDPVRVFALQGPTGMGFAKLMHDSAAGDAALSYDFHLAASPEEFKGDIIQGNFEIAAVPTNLAAVLYAKTEGAVSVAAVNTMGVLHLIENGETIQSIEDLKGKTIYSSGQGSVPEYVMNYILDTFDIDCEVIYEANHDVVATGLVAGTINLAVLPEPKVTTVLKKAEAPEGLRAALDLTQIWKDACEKNDVDSALYMGCVIVNNDWAQEYPAEVKAFLEEYKASIDYVGADTEAAAEVIAEQGIVPAAKIAQAAIPGSNIVYEDGEKMAAGLASFYKILHSYAPASVGGAVPDEKIYYIAK
ncbi:MAG: ABC transporter substrate-binding protein [Clostridiales bacterium]|nr:ABC transporter substrate-binding protein [Clostridiales bacterium]